MYTPEPRVVHSKREREWETAKDRELSRAVQASLILNATLGIDTGHHCAKFTPVPRKLHKPPATFDHFAPFVAVATVDETYSSLDKQWWDNSDNGNDDLFGVRDEDEESYISSPSLTLSHTSTETWRRSELADTVMSIEEYSISEKQVQYEEEVKIPQRMLLSHARETPPNKFVPAPMAKTTMSIVSGHSTADNEGARMLDNLCASTLCEAIGVDVCNDFIDHDDGDGNFTINEMLKDAQIVLIEKPILRSIPNVHGHSMCMVDSFTSETPALPSKLLAPWAPRVLCKCCEQTKPSQLTSVATRYSANSVPQIVVDHVYRLSPCWRPVSLAMLPLRTPDATIKMNRQQDGAHFAICRPWYWDGDLEVNIDAWLAHSDTTASIRHLTGVRLAALPSIAGRGPICNEVHARLGKNASSIDLIRMRLPSTVRNVLDPAGGLEWFVLHITWAAGTEHPCSTTLAFEATTITQTAVLVQHAGDDVRYTPNAHAQCNSQELPTAYRFWFGTPGQIPSACGSGIDAWALEEFMAACASGDGTITMEVTEDDSTNYGRVTL